MKFPTRENIDRWMFDYTEGNLSPEQETLLENYILNNPDLEVDLDAWQMAAVSTEELIYTEKEKSYKKRRLLPYFIGAFSALLVISMLFWNYNQQQSYRQQQVAQSTSTSNKTVKSSPVSSTTSSNTNNGRSATFILNIGGATIPVTSRLIYKANANQRYTAALTHIETGVANGTIIKVQWLVSANTGSVYQRELTINGTLGSLVIP